jgi:hypothetical protein
MSGQKLEIVYGLEAISTLDAWASICECLKEAGVSSSVDAKLDGVQVKFDTVNDNIQNLSLKHFHIELDEISIVFGVVRTWEHVLIRIDNHSSLRYLHWDTIVKAFLSKAVFTQAWVSDINYQFWQNAEDPLQYKAHGKSYEGLPMKSNGLPPPLEQMNIDTSRNPGRRVIRSGYVEAVGSCMWLSDEFWLRVGSDKKKFIDEFADKIEQMEEGVLKLKVSDMPFTDTSTGVIQDKIRDILYS